jgi:hypothetical protein
VDFALQRFQAQIVADKDGPIDLAQFEEGLIEQLLPGRARKPAQDRFGIG